MKKYLACLLAVILIIGAVPALAGESANTSVVWLQRADGVTVAQGVLAFDGRTVVTVYHALEAVDELYAYSDEMEKQVRVAGVLAASREADVALLYLEQDAGVKPLKIDQGDRLQVGHQVTALCAAGEDSSQGRVTAFVQYGGAWCIQFTDESKNGKEGGALLDETGALIGIIVGSWGDAPDLKVALPIASAVTLQEQANPNSLTALESLYPEKDTAQEAPQTDSLLSDLLGDMVQQDGDEKTVFVPGISLSVIAQEQVRVDWSDCHIADLDDDSAFVIYYTDEENPYVRFAFAEAQDTSADLYLVPGRTYVIWVQHAHGTPDTSLMLPEEETDRCAAFVTMPEAKVFNKYGCITDQMYIGVLAAGTEADQTESIQPVTKLDAAVMTDDETDLYFCATSRYRVKKNAETSLTLTLTTPDGACYDTWGGFIFEAGRTEDAWFMPLYELTDMVETYAGAWQPGEYILTLYFGGAQAGELSFTLQ